MSTNSTTGTVYAQGAEVPALGFGTARMTGDDCRSAVETALALGYRHADTAQMYDNEAAVGAAIAESDVNRETSSSSRRWIRTTSRTTTSSRAPGKASIASGRRRSIYS